MSPDATTCELHGQQTNLVEKVIKNAIHVAREIGPTYLQLYTPCILEIGKNSMEGLQEMRDAEKPTERFAYKGTSAIMPKSC